MKKMKGTDFFLPEDLLLEILSQLPVKTLLRFKCVCKSWYDLLVNPDNNVSKDRRRLINCHHDLPNESCDIDILSYDNLNVVEQDFRFDQQLPNTNRFSHPDRWCIAGVLNFPRLLGSYNGLVCFSDFFLNEFVFWNPTTRQTKLICPSTRISSRPKHTEHAFGYDFKRKDYKLIKFCPMTNVRPCKYEAEVYSFNTDTWRESHAAIPDGVIFDDKKLRPTICLKGVYSTMAYTKRKKRDARSYFLFTIDMGNEEFILTPMPQAKRFEAKDWKNKALVELNKSIAFMKYAEESYAVFVLNDYGPNGAWTKLYTISGYKHPVGSWKNEILFNPGSHSNLISLNPTTHETKSFGVHGYCKQVLDYNESLVWVDDVSRRFRKEDEASQLP